MSKSEISEKIIKFSNLNATKSNRFRWRSDSINNSNIAEQLSLISVEKVDFRGKISAQGKNKWLLSGHLGATAIQKCVVTLQAVKCRIDEKIKRIYVPMEEIPSVEKDDSHDVKLELDENLEPLAKYLDLSLIAQEILALSLPDYPRSNNTDYVSISYSDDKKITQPDNEGNPFAILSALKKN